MAAARKSAEEQYNLIMECRSSGLTDYQWCSENGINPGTFYNWVKRLRQKACYDIPEPTGRLNHCPTPKQDIVPLEVVPDECSTPVISNPNCTVPFASGTGSISPIQISFANASISLQNDIAPALLGQILGFLGEHLC